MAAVATAEAGVGAERGRSTVQRGKCPGKNDRHSTDEYLTNDRD